MEELANVNWTLIIPLVIVQFVLLIAAAIDIARRPQTNGPKWMWVIVILFVNTLGPILYFIFGRKK